MQISSHLASVAHTAANFASNLRSAPAADVVEPADVLARSPDAPAEKEWTVLVYLEGRDRLAYSADLALQQMEQVGSSDRINVVAQSTIAPTMAERLYPNMRSTPTRRYYITQDADPTSVNSPVVGDLGGQVRLNQDNLRDFVSWGVKSFPAKHYLLVVKKHGLGFAKADPVVPLSAREAAEALRQAEVETGRKMDVVSFDSCSMQQLEVAYELKDRAHVMTGSQEDVYAVDFPYASVLAQLDKSATTATAQDVGHIVVDAHRTEVQRGIQTAVDLDKVGAVAPALRTLVETIVSEQVPRGVVYTNMLKAASMEPQETLRTAYNFRDIRGFLQHLSEDPHVTSPTVREAAQAADKALAATIVDHSITDGKKRLKDAQGYTTFVPWKAPSEALEDSYHQLAFDRDASWMRLVDYVFEEHQAAQPAAAASGTTTNTTTTTTAPPEKLSLVQSLGKKAIGQYKKYISPYLLVACRCQPSCSQYTREAIEKHGLVQGTKLGFMRLLTCAGAEGVVDDPVPQVPGQSTPGAMPPPAPEVVIEPPVRHEKSSLRKSTDSLLISAGRLAGRTVGGLFGAVACLPAGVAFGATLGWQAGRATIDQTNRNLLQTYRRESVRALVKLEHVVGDPGFKTFNAIKHLTNNETAARVVGGAVGAAAGTAIGVLGALYKGYRWGAMFGGMWAGNMIKDRLGELPRHPTTENILQHDYGQQA